MCEPGPKVKLMMMMLALALSLELGVVFQDRIGYRQTAALGNLNTSGFGFTYSNYSTIQP